MHHVAGFELKKNVQDMGMLFWTLFLPIVFTVLFISIFTSGLDQTDSVQVIGSIVPGYTVMFVFFIMISMSESFLKDQKNGMVARMASTPLTNHSYLLGKWISYMYIVFIQIVILLLFGKLVYDVPLEQPFYIFLLAIFLSFMVTGIGLALAVVAKTTNMGIAITQVIALGGAVLGGLWMPVEIMPDFFQTISRFIPQYWAHQGLLGGMQGNLITGDFVKISLILIGIGAAGFAVALVRYPNFLKRAKG